MADEGPIELVLVADVEAPRRARGAVGRALAGLPGDVGFRARLLVSELVANSVQHAAAEAAAGTVWVRVERLGGAVRVEVSDGGSPFDSEVRLVSERATSPTCTQREVVSVLERARLLVIGRVTSH